MPSSSRQRSVTLASHTPHGKRLRIAIASSPVTSRRSSPGSIALGFDPDLDGRDLRQERAHLVEIDAAPQRRHRGEQLRAVRLLRQARIEHRDHTAIVTRPDQTTRALRQHQRGDREVDRGERVEAAPPARAHAAAACSGSSGTGNGILSITTSTHDAPAASIPAQNDRVPTNTDVSSSTNSFVNRPESRSPCVSTT